MEVLLEDAVLPLHMLIAALNPLMLLCKKRFNGAQSTFARCLTVQSL